MANWQGGAEGAAGGALAGGAVGGPIGAGIGGLIGGGMGMFGSSGPSAEEKRHQKMLMDFYGQVGQRNAPQNNQVALGDWSSFRQNQSDMISRLEAMSQGKGPSLAAEQMKAGMNRNQSAQASMANSGRGGPMMALAAANNMGRMNAETNQGAGMARIAEQQMALQQLGLSLHSARGADEGMSRFNASSQNTNSLANLDARLRTMGMNDQARLGILGQFGKSATDSANRPSTGQSILAGGAGMFAMGMGKGAPAPGGGGQSWNPFAGGGGYAPTVGAPGGQGGYEGWGNNIMNPNAW